MALREAFSKFLRGKAESKRAGQGEGGAGGDDRSATALENLATNVESGDDPDLVVLVERLEGFYLPDRDEFVPTEVAVEVIEGFGDEGNDDPKAMLQQLADVAPGGGDQPSAQA
jgi:hypothetical protein